MHYKGASTRSATAEGKPATLIERTKHVAFCVVLLTPIETGVCKFACPLVEPTEKRAAGRRGRW